LRQTPERGGKRQVIFAATAEHSMWPVDAKAPERRPSWAPASIAKAPTRSAWWQPSSPEPSGTTRLASISRAPSSAPGGQLSPKMRMPFPSSSRAPRSFFYGFAFSFPINDRTRQDRKPLTALRASPDTTFAALEAPAGQDTPSVTATLRLSLTFSLSMGVFPSMAASRLVQETRTCRS
jgi:hypothetical protein